ncbi:MAG: non-heme iron oxygenase ferredoxin subunit [Proteobacteria bacterium]|nr:non-heme iron oxygenase ferredoxin subunit [Pseudomonadota bacterium]
MRACAADTLQDGDVRRIDLPDRSPIALFRLGEQFFATDDTCTHGAASLADGFVEDGEVECPYHGGRFDIRTGAATLHPCTAPLRTYPAGVELGEVVIDLTHAVADEGRNDEV